MKPKNNDHCRLISADNDTCLHFECVDLDCLCGGMFSVSDLWNGLPRCPECHGPTQCIGVVVHEMPVLNGVHLTAVGLSETR